MHHGDCARWLWSRMHVYMHAYVFVQVSVVEQGGVELLVSALARHSADDLPVQLALCQALWKLSRGDEQRVQVRSSSLNFVFITRRCFQFIFSPLVAVVFLL